ncbi:hypothetical protein RSAG8_04568, partial [Rhizoctonia solani AG-8 WAC10335]
MCSQAGPEVICRNECGTVHVRTQPNPLPLVQNFKIRRRFW